MRRFNSLNPIYAITDYENHTHEEVLERSESLFRAGINLIQYRNKSCDIDQSIEYAASLKQLCIQYDVTLIINDSIKITEAIEADGLHIGKDDFSITDAKICLPNKIIGVSCYNDLNLAIEAEKKGADYVAFGAFFPTTSKSNTVPAPIGIIQRAKSVITIPIVAIGGITPINAGPLVSAKVDFIAAISGLYKDSDSYSAAKNYLSLFKN